MHHMDTDYAHREKTWQQLHKNAMNYTEQILEAISHKTTAVWSPTTHLKTIQIKDTAGEVRMNS